MKFAWSLIAIGILSGGCQQVREYYTEKSVTSDCGSGPVSTELIGYLNFCGKEFTSPSLTIANSCLNRAVTVLPKLAPDCRSKYESRIKDSVESITIAHMEGIKDPAATTGEPLTYETGARLFARWYNASNVLYPDSYSDYTKTEPGSFQAAFYSIFAVSKRKVVNLMAGKGLLAFKDDSESGLDRSAERLSEVASIQASAMFDEGATELAIETILPFLQSTADRAEVLLSIYDITCKLARCAPAVEENARYQLVQLMSSYLDKTKLFAAIAAAKGVPASLRSPFNLLLKNSDKVEELIANGNLSKKPVLANFKGNSWPAKRQLLRGFISYPASSTLTRFVRLSAQFADIDENFLAMKAFDKRSTERLAYNPSAEAITSIASNLRTLNESLAGDLVELENRKQTALANYRDLVKVDSAALKFDTDRMSLDLADAFNDLDVMRQSLSDGRERRATFLKEAVSIASQKSDSFVLEDSQFKTIGASSTISDGKSAWTDLDEISGVDVSYTAENDDELLSISVGSAWHPVCALKKSPLAEFAKDDVLVGAGGFQMSMSNSSALVNARGKERREVDYADVGVRAEVCAKASNEVNGTGVSASVCGYYQVGKRVEKSSYESETQSNSVQYTSAFEAGLRLPDTPFPNYPAGALLAAVQEPVGAGFNTIRYLVVDKESSMVLKKGQKIRFVVNDCKSSDSRGELKIEISPRISTTAASVSMLEDFSSILLSDDINARKAKIIQDGSAIESEIQALRSYILKNFAEKNLGDSDYRKIPLVAIIFDTWLDQDMLEVRKQYEIRMQERKVRDLSLAYSAQNSRMNSEVRVEKIQSEIFETSLANLEQNLLSYRLQKVLSFTDIAIMPLIDLYYPGLKIDNKFRELNNLPLNASLKIIGEKLERTFSQINTDVLVNALYRNIGGSQYQNLVIRIPRPEVDASDSEWPVASMPIRQAVWTYLQHEKPSQQFGMEIPVEALYQQARIKGRLTCNQILPVIDSSMIGFTVAKDVGGQQRLMDELNGGPATITLTVGPRVQFATVSGAIDYRIVNGTVNSSQISQIPISYGVSISKLVDQLGTLTASGVAARAAYGYSPFGDFNLDGLNLIRNFTVKKIGSLDGIEEVALFFRAKVDSTQTKPTWIGECVSEI